MIPRDAGEMPIQRLAGIFELFLASDFGHVVRDFVHAVVADKRHRAFQRKPVPAGKLAAQLAAAIKNFIVPRNRLACDPERMPCGTDTSSGSFQQFAGDVAWIGPATSLSAVVDGFGKSDRVGQLLLEYRVQKLDDELHRCFIVVVKDYLEVAGPGLNITHETVSFDE